jgi:hypothetical protein
MATSDDDDEETSRAHAIFTRALSVAASARQAWVDGLGLLHTLSTLHARHEMFLFVLPMLRSFSTSHEDMEVRRLSAALCDRLAGADILAGDGGSNLRPS